MKYPSQVIHAKVSIFNIANVFDELQKKIHFINPVNALLRNESASYDSPRSNVFME